MEERECVLDETLLIDFNKLIDTVVVKCATTSARTASAWRIMWIFVYYRSRAFHYMCIVNKTYHIVIIGVIVGGAGIVVIRHNENRRRHYLRCNREYA